MAGPDAPLRDVLSKLLAHPAVRLAAPVLVTVIAVFVLHGLAANVRWSDIKADLAAAPWATLAMAAGFTVISFAAIAAYDVIAVRGGGHTQVPSPVAALAGASGYAISNVTGFSYLTGTMIRYRIYGSFGLGATDVAAIFATSWFAFWLEFLLIFGVLLIYAPLGLSAVLPISPMLETGLGIAILVALAGLLAFLARGRSTVSIFGHGFALPSIRQSGLLLAASVMEMIGAALTLYILLPADLVASFPYFFVVYIAAIGLGVLSHSPGGLGVFEATLIAGLGAGGRSDVLAAVLLYRLIYNGMPFVAATVGLAVAWAVGKRSRLALADFNLAGTATGAANWMYRLSESLVPLVSAGIAFLAGLFLLVSGNLPADGTRLGHLADVLPLSFIQASHLAGSVVGLLLIVIARGLFLRLSRAWLVAMGLMAAGFVASLAKGLDWEEALSLMISTGLLWVFRKAFDRVSGASVFRLTGAWVASILALLAAVFWVGLFAYGHVAYRDDLWWDFALHGDASRFLRASLAIAIVLGVLAFNSILLRRDVRIAAQPVPDIVRQLVAQSPDAEAAICLMGDKAFLIAEDGRAFLTYADTGGSLIVKGDPVGAADAGARLIWQIREQAYKGRRRIAFYGVSQRFLPTYLDMGLSILKIGEVARVDLARFTVDGSTRKDFRQARNRALRDGYAFEVIPRSSVPMVLDALRVVSDAWLALKQGEEKGFAMGAFEDAYMANFDIAVLRNVASGKLVAFANLLQGGDHAELSLDLIRYHPNGPNFAMDALFAEIMLWGKARGFAWFSLGAAPFSGIDSRHLATVWNRIGSFIYAHGEHFYHFEGLRAFKQKFDPDWQPNYLASSRGIAVPKILYEVNLLISGGLKGLIR